MADPHPSLVYASAYFDRDPQRWARELKIVAEEEGYGEIKPTLIMLEECHADKPSCMKILTLLRQPEWEWRRCEEDVLILFFGIPETSGFVARGYYITGKYETGEVRVLDEPGNTEEYSVALETVTDPREEYVARRVRPKVYREDGKYYIALAGRFVDLVRHGIPRLEIQTPGKDHYLSRFPAFAITDGPWSDKEAARAHKPAL